MLNKLDIAACIAEIAGMQDKIKAAAAAQIYTRYGMKAIPCNGKVSISSWAGSEEDFAKSVTKAWKEFPGANVSIMTGRDLGAWVLDLDVPKLIPPKKIKPDWIEGIHYQVVDGQTWTLDGVDLFKKACAIHGEKNGPLSMTLVQRTHSGGMHLLFAMPEDGEDIRGRAAAFLPSAYFTAPEALASDKTVPGVDIRGTGGYIVVAPSRGEKGVYSWDLSRCSKIRPAPSWLLDLVRRKSQPEKKKPAALPAFRPAAAGKGNKDKWFSGLLNGLLGDVASAIEGTRNDTLNYAAWRLYLHKNAAGWTEDFLQAQLIAAAMQAGLEERESKATIRSAFNGAATEPQQDKPPLTPSAPRNCVRCSSQPHPWLDPLRAAGIPVPENIFYQGGKSPRLFFPFGCFAEGGTPELKAWAVAALDWRDGTVYAKIKDGKKQGNAFDCGPVSILDRFVLASDFSTAAVLRAAAPQVRTLWTLSNSNYNATAEAIRSVFPHAEIGLAPASSEDTVKARRLAKKGTVKLVTPADGRPSFLEQLLSREKGAPAIAGTVDQCFAQASAPEALDRPEEKEKAGGAALGPQVILTAGNSYQAGIEILKHLADRGLVYRDFLRLVTVSAVPRKIKINDGYSEAHITQIVPLELDAIGQMANHFCIFLVPEGTPKPGHPQKFRRTRAPKETLKNLLETAQHATDWQAVPELRGLTSCPCLLSTGEILSRAGYDKDSGLFAAFEEGTFPPVPEVPTIEDARQAMKKLENALAEFPFSDIDPKAPEPLKTSVSSSVALSAMLTTVLGDACQEKKDGGRGEEEGRAPLFGFTAPTKGTGKTALANVIAIMATGNAAPVVMYTQDEVAFEKKLFAQLLEGSEVTLLDNIEGIFNSESLCACLTSDKYKSRILGFSKNQTASTKTLWLATGNNLTPTGDLTRRILLCTLDAKMEHPANRVFKRSLYGWTKEHRPELVTACLTVLRAHIVAGMPGAKCLRKEGENYGSFSSWNDNIRGALIWLGYRDPLISQAMIEENDPHRAAEIAFLESMYKAFSEPKTIQDIVEFAFNAPAAGQLPNTAPADNTAEYRKNLAAALVELTSTGTPEKIKIKLPYLLRGLKKQIKGGYYLSGKKAAGNREKWTVRRAG